MTPFDGEVSPSDESGLPWGLVMTGLISLDNGVGINVWREVRDYGDPGLVRFPVTFSFFLSSLLL